MKFFKENILGIILSLTVGGMFCSCSETDGGSDEYADWKLRNEAFFTDIYNKAKDADGWKVIASWSLTDDVEKDIDDYIAVQVLKEGQGTESPLYTDSVRVHYSGRLMPSANYAEGFVFDGYEGQLDADVAMPSKFAVSGVVPGFSTALQNMHVGDMWRVYIPYNLGYGNSDNSTIPAYSTLIFDIYLVAYYHPNIQVPDYRAKGNETDIIAAW